MAKILSIGRTFNSQSINHAALLGLGFNSLSLLWKRFQCRQKFPNSFPVFVASEQYENIFTEHAPRYNRVQNRKFPRPISPMPKEVTPN